ncbi:MAG: hypothetical protein WAJ85_03110 [Candidatus Baltobacteraceae bacterium]
MEERESQRPAARERLGQLGAALDILCAKLADRERAAAHVRALDVLKRESAALDAPARVIGHLMPEHVRLQAQLKALEERHARALQQRNAAERELSKLAKEHLDLSSIARLSNAIERLRSDRELRAAEAAQTAERERALSAEAESLRRAGVRLEVLRKKVLSAQSAPSYAERRRDRARALFDRANADFTVRSKAHAEAQKFHAATLWAQRERLVQSERLRRSLPDAWRPSASPSDAELWQIRAALEAARANAESAVRERNLLASQAADLKRELDAAQNAYQTTVCEVAENRRRELGRSLAAMAEALRTCEMPPPPVRRQDDFEGLAAWCEELLAWLEQMRPVCRTLRAAASAEKEKLDASAEALLRAHGVSGLAALADRYVKESVEAERLARHQRFGADGKLAFRTDDELPGG